MDARMGRIVRQRIGTYFDLIRLIIVLNYANIPYLRSPHPNNEIREHEIRILSLTVARIVITQHCPIH